MPKNLASLKIVNEFLQNIGGNYAPEIIDAYEKRKKPITDEEIEKKTRLKITEIRAILNRLHYRGIAEYNKKRNEKTGWYIYSWEIKRDRIAELVSTQQLEKTKKIQEQIEFEKTHAFFNCKKKCQNTVFEIAAEYNFKCPQCGQTTSPINNKKHLIALQTELKQVLEEINELNKIAEGNKHKY